MKILVKILFAPLLAYLWFFVIIYSFYDAIDELLDRKFEHLLLENDEEDKEPERNCTTEVE